MVLSSALGAMADSVLRRVTPPSLAYGMLAGAQPSPALAR
jgi:hypothetical protein